MQAIDRTILNELPLNSISKVEIYKRDEITTDLISCDVFLGEKYYSFHEEMAGWEKLLDHLAELPGFEEDWRNSVVLPAFDECRTIAFERQID